MKINSVIKSSTFCLQQNRLTELTPKASFDASSGIQEARQEFESSAIKQPVRIMIHHGYFQSQHSRS